MCLRAKELKVIKHALKKQQMYHISNFALHSKR